MRLLRKLAQRTWRSYRKGWLLMLSAALLALSGCSVNNFTGPNPQTPSISQIKAAK